MRLPTFNASSNYGLCNKCDYFGFNQTQLGKESGWCDRAFSVHTAKLEIQPNRKDPIEICTFFYPKGQPDIYTMQSTAWIIDISTNKVGFSTEEERIIKITLPEEE